VRASDGKKKLSTTVPTKAAERFNASLTTLQKAYMDGLRAGAHTCSHFHST